jgi:hypothetical protein
LRGDLARLNADATKLAENVHELVQMFQRAEGERDHARDLASLLVIPRTEYVSAKLAASVSAANVYAQDTRRR